jgi:hypothetical protein
MLQKRSDRMKNEWDIVDAVSPAEDLTEHQSNPRRIARGPAALSAVMLVIGSAFSLSASTVVPLDETTSDVISVVHRAPKSLSVDTTQVPSRMGKSGVDFTRARTGESLARAFDAYFRPPSADEQEAEPDDSCFF